MGTYKCFGQVHQANACSAIEEGSNHGHMTGGYGRHHTQWNGRQYHASTVDDGDKAPRDT
jgi:hypothetical protein